MTDITAEVRRPGRPRSVECDEAILHAVLDEYGERGFEGMSVDAVAARAGVSKATIYRRYESKLALVTAAMYYVAEERKPAPDTGSLVGDLHALLEQLGELMHDSTLGRSIRMMVADGVGNPELAAAHDEFVQFRRTGTKVVFERAMARGELRADTDVEVAADVLAGPLFYRHLVSHMPIDRAYARALVDGFLRAYGI